MSGVPSSEKALMLYGVSHVHHDHDDNHGHYMHTYSGTYMSRKSGHCCAMNPTLLPGVHLVLPHTVLVLVANTLLGTL